MLRVGMHTRTLHVRVPPIRGILVVVRFDIASVFHQIA